MKIKRILSALLAILMASACLSIVSFAADDAELMAIDPIKLAITNCGAKDQKCTLKNGVLDAMGRTVQQIVPDDSEKPAETISPAWFADGTQKAAIRNAGYGYKAIKFVYYTSASASAAPTLTMYFENGTNDSDKNAWTKSHGQGVLKAGGPSQAGKWQTAVFELPAQCTSDVCHAFMFYVHGNEQVQNHMGEDIFVGYVALFDTAENAIAHKSDFEGDLALTGIKVGGTAISGFDAATTSYTVDLAGASAVPEITVTGTGDANKLKIEKSDVDTTTGEATATVIADGTVYTISFTGGATKTSVTPFTVKIDTAGAAQGCIEGSFKESVTDPYGRSVSQIFPGGANNVAPASFFYAGSINNTARNPDYKVVRFVYYTSTQANPNKTMGVWAHPNNAMTSRGSATLVANETYTAPGGGWNVATYDLTSSDINFANGEFIFAYMFNLFQEKGDLHKDDIVYFGDITLFGSVADIANHTNKFEGDLDITSIKVGGNDVTFTGGVANVDAAGAATVPKLTVTAIGNTNDLVITEGKFDKDGNATSTIANGGKTLYTVNFTGGAPKEIPPIEIPFEWNGYNNGMSSVDSITDEFTRSYKKYNPLGQYYDGQQDKWSSSAVGPGGNIFARIPDGFTIDDYSAIKLVYYSNEDFVPTLTQYTADVTNPSKPAAVYDTAPEKGKWNVIYYNIKALPVYQVHFTSDLSSNHPDGDYRIAYAAFFSDMDAAKAHKSAFEGEFAISDVRLDGVSIGNVTEHTVDLAGSGSVPKLTAVATGDAEGVTITNGIIGADGTAVSTIKKDDSTLVTVNFTGASTEFKIIDIKVDGVSVKDFASDKAEYTFNLGFAAPEPVITYTFQGIEKQVDISINNEKDGAMVTKYVATLSVDGAVAYTLTFNVSTEKPRALLNTLYKLQNDKSITVGYFGGSVTAGTGASNANLTSWRGLTRDWIKSNFPKATVNEINAAIGGTGAIFGVFRADQDLIKEKAPDLIFIEMCINDNYDGIYGTNEMYVYIESMIQNIYDSNPMSDIVFIITGDHGTLQKDYNGTEEYGIPYKLIGEYYDIPVIYVGRELAKTMAEENGGQFPSANTHEIWKKYFLRTYASNALDSVHPADSGYAHYAKTIIDWMTPNLPTTYVPTADDYKAKTIPEQDYCEVNNKGDLMADATMVNPATFNSSYLGKYSINKGEVMFGGSPLMGYNAGDVISLKFNGSSLGMWTWSYGETNSNTYKTGTNITYSIDGGEPKTLYVYRSFANNKIYTLATGLSDGEHTIRIHHDDNKAPLHVYNFLIWDLHGRTASIDTVPYFDFATEEYDITLDGESFADFDGDVFSYQIPVELTAGDSYPVLAFNARSDFYGYAIEQASADNNAAKLVIDNVGTYIFEFVNSNAVEIGGTTNSDKDEANGSVTFVKAAEYKIQVKAEKDDWANAAEYDAGITEVTGLAPGKYNIRYIIEDGVYGFSQTFTIMTVFPYENIYYVAANGTGDGTSATNAAASGTSLSDLVAKAANYFGDKAKTEECCIVLVGDVVSSTSTQINMTLFKDLTITSEVGAVLHIYTHITHANRTDASGKITYKDIDIILGNPNSNKDRQNDEIMIDARANELAFDEFNIIGYATNAYGQTRTAGLYLNYWTDGASGGAIGVGKPLTVKTTGKTFALVRGTGYNPGNETGDAKFVIDGGSFTDIKMGGHGKAETHTGVFRAEINGGDITALILSGDAATQNIGSVIAVVNGGVIADAKVASTSSDEKNVDRVLILNNDTNPGTITTGKIDYILRGSVGGSADATTTNNRLTGFVFTTDKETVVINKGLATEKVLTVVDGSASIAVADLTAGDYTVTYEDIPLPEGVVEVTASIKLGRPAGTVPAYGNHLKVLIKDVATSAVLKTIDLEDAASKTNEDGELVVDLTIDTNGIECDTVEIVAQKAGYAPMAVTASLEDLEDDIVAFFNELEADFEKGHGDIKGSFDNEFGDGKVDVDDFIRVVRGFDPTATSDYRTAIDLDEDGSVSVKDLAIVKKNFGFKAK